MADPQVKPDSVRPPKPDSVKADLHAQPGTQYVQRSDGSVVRDERHADPRKTGGTELMNALPAIATADAVASRAVNEYGSLGLQGTIKTIGNATWMVLGACLVVFFVYNQERIRNEDRSDSRTRDQAHAAEMRALTSEVRGLMNQVQYVTESSRTGADLMKQAAAELRSINKKLEVRVGDVPRPRELPE